MPNLLIIDLIFCRHDFQFFNTQRLSELYEKEVRYLMVSYLICSLLLGLLFFSQYFSAGDPSDLLSLSIA